MAVKPQRKVARKPASKPYSFRFPRTNDLEDRLKKAAKACEQPANKLCQDAIQKLVETIEKHDYRVVLPLEFALTHVPTRNPELDRK